MTVENHDMGDNIFMGDLEKEITSVDGVISIIDLSVYNLYGGNGYSTDKCPLPISDETGDFKISDATAVKINLKEVDNVLYSDYNSMYEILNDSNIQVKCKLM
jgi:hypothetical protein